MSASIIYLDLYNLQTEYSGDWQNQTSSEIGAVGDLKSVLLTDNLVVYFMDK